MADFTVHIPDAFIPRAISPVQQRFDLIASEPVGIKLLAYHGVTAGTATNTQKAEIVCQYHIWVLVMNSETDIAQAAAWQAAYDAAVNDFNP
jgi:hypothetical protein